MNGLFLTSGYEDEKKSLAARIDELQQQIATVTERKRDISRFIQIVGKYSDIQELTYENVHEFIDTRSRVQHPENRNPLQLCRTG